MTGLVEHTIVNDWMGRVAFGHCNNGKCVVDWQEESKMRMTFSCLIVVLLVHLYSRGAFGVIIIWGGNAVLSSSCLTTGVPRYVPERRGLPPPPPPPPPAGGGGGGGG